MDLLDEENELNLFDHSWRIYSVNPNQPPQYISDEAVVINSLVNEGCMVEGNVEHSVLFQGVHVGKGAIVKDCVIMPDAVIGEGVYIERAIVPPDVEIPPHSVICSDDILLVTKEWLTERKMEDIRKG